jgi:hypothetical protein
MLGTTPNLFVGNLSGGHTAPACVAANRTGEHAGRFGRDARPERVPVHAGRRQPPERRHARRRPPRAASSTARAPRRRRTTRRRLGAAPALEVLTIDNTARRHLSRGHRANLVVRRVNLSAACSRTATRSRSARASPHVSVVTQVGAHRRDGRGRLLRCGAGVQPGRRRRVGVLRAGGSARTTGSRSRPVASCVTVREPSGRFGRGLGWRARREPRPRALGRAPGDDGVGPGDAGGHVERDPRRFLAGYVDGPLAIAVRTLDATR